LRGREDGGKDPEWKDYLAIFLALLQTVALPVLVLVLMLLAALVVLRLAH
jgi:lipopolysaccharide export LptBFGC system permease protein LptF